jgi:SAM-dependent methyltransferase
MSATERFSNRVDDYVRARPGYPAAFIAALAETLGLSPSWTIVDVGAGTGISSAVLLAHGCSVIAVEPNHAMRAAAVALLGTSPRFRAVDGSAEATGLESALADAVVAAQAFHWFDRRRFRAEAMRILKPGGIVALLWNVRRAESTPFAAAYEALLREFGTDYLSVRHENVKETELAAFFGGPFVRRAFDNAQSLDHAGLRARLLSSSYMPAAGHPQFDAMIAALDALFAEHQEDGRVEMDYELRLFAGPLAPQAPASFS